MMCGLLVLPTPPPSLQHKDLLCFTYQFHSLLPQASLMKDLRVSDIPMPGSFYISKCLKN